MRRSSFLMFINIINRDGMQKDIAWILTKADGMEIQRRQYVSKPFEVMRLFDIHAYFYPYVVQSLERIIFLYSPTVVVFNQDQADEMVDSMGVKSISSYDLILLERIAGSRSASELSHLKELFQLITLENANGASPSIRQAEVIRTCYFQWIDRNLSIRNLVKEAIERSGSAILHLLNTHSWNQEIRSAPKEEKPAIAGSEQAGCLKELWNVLVLGLGLLFLAPIVMLIITLLYKLVEGIKNLFD